MIEVMITDDHQIVREGLKRVLEEYTTDIKVVQEASGAAELLEKLSRKLPDIVVLDIMMPKRGGLETLKDVKALYPKLPVLILSTYSEDSFAIRAFKAGASGYVTKASSVSDELVSAIRKIVYGKKKYITLSVAEQLAEQMDHNFEMNRHELLSDREYQILCLIASGKKSSTIARELSLSIQTIHTYRTRLKQKMKFRSIADLTRYAIKHKLID